MQIGQRDNEAQVNTCRTKYSIIRAVFNQSDMYLILRGLAGFSVTLVRRGETADQLCPKVPCRIGTPQSFVLIQLPRFPQYLQILPSRLDLIYEVAYHMSAWIVGRLQAAVSCALPSGMTLEARMEAPPIGSVARFECRWKGSAFSVTCTSRLKFKRGIRDPRNCWRYRPCKRHFRQTRFKRPGRMTLWRSTPHMQCSLS